MAKEDFSSIVEDGQFADLGAGSLLAKFLNEIHRKGIGGAPGELPECVHCDSSVEHPIDVEHLVYRYTRSESNDGVIVPVNVRGVELITLWCRVCSDAVFDRACLDLKIMPVADVRKRLTVWKDVLVATIAQHETELAARKSRIVDRNGSHAGCSPSYGPRRDLNYKQERNKAVKARHRSGAAARQLGEGDVTRRFISGLRKKVAALEKLHVDGVPDDDVSKICARTRELLIEKRYMPLRTIAARIKVEAMAAAGANTPGKSKFGKPKRSAVSSPL